MLTDDVSPSPARSSLPSKRLKVSRCGQASLEIVGQETLVLKSFSLGNELEEHDPHASCVFHFPFKPPILYMQ